MPEDLVCLYGLERGLKCLCDLVSTYYALHKFSENSTKLQMLNLISSLTAKADCSPTRLDYSEGQSRKTD